MKINNPMKKLFLLLAVVAISSCQAQEKQFSEAALKANLISLEGDNTNLNAILKRQEGKTVVIEIWASWCSDCIKAMPLLKQTQADNPKVEYIFISMDKAADKWKAGIEKHKLEGAHYWAPDGMKGAFGTGIDLDWIPRYIVVDKTGKVILYRATEKEYDQVNAILKKSKK
jgi:thiol-disulfide isomerase/thioredoxin